MDSTPRSGHYTCRLYYPAANSAWWYYNNSERRVATPVEVLTTAPVRGSVERAYLAFYENEMLCDSRTAAPTPATAT